jgi:hypothetical protein
VFGADHPHELNDLSPLWIWTQVAIVVFVLASIVIALVHLL